MQEQPAFQVILELLAGAVLQIKLADSCSGARTLALLAGTAAPVVAVPGPVLNRYGLRTSILLVLGFACFTQRR